MRGVASRETGNRIVDGQLLLSAFSSMQFCSDLPTASHSPLILALRLAPDIPVMLYFCSITVIDLIP